MTNLDFEYKQINTKQLIIPTEYQRALCMDRVKKIVANFDENLVNPIKVSYRNGKFYVFDGQHTVAVLKLRNGNDDLLVPCKIYRGLSKEEEAKLFVEQTGLSRKVDCLAKYKALYISKDEDVVNMIKLTELTGLYIDFIKSRLPNRITAVSKAFKIYKDNKENYVDILKLIKDTWDGDVESLRTEILGGVQCFYNRYKSKYDRNRFVKQLSIVSPKTIIREGKVYSEGGDIRFARCILAAYNKKSNLKRLEDEL